MKPAAVILAAGRSSRLGASKPMVCLGGKTLLERAVFLFRDAGLKDIRVVAGCNAQDLVPELRRLDAAVVLNSEWEKGMFSSVRAAAAAVSKSCDACFILPVDVCSVRAHTVRQLISAANGKILYPTYQGRRGHPPLIPADHLPGILAWPGTGGLRGYLAGCAAQCTELPVADRGVLLDLDTPADLKRLQRRFRHPARPSPGECRALMDMLAVPQNIVAHGKTVAKAAIRLACAVKAAGHPIDVDLVGAAALVHDMARTQPDHARTAGAILTDLGYRALADIVAVHMDQPVGERIGEAELVFLADKFVEGNRVVSPENRFLDKIAAFGQRPEARARIEARWSAAREILKRVQRITGKPAAAILSPETRGKRHDLSDEARGN